MRISHTHQKKIINFIHDNFYEADISLCDYLCNNSSYIIKHLNLPYESDIFYFTIGDINSNDYTNFVELFFKELNKFSTAAKVLIKEDFGDYILANSSYGKNINIGIKNSLMNDLISLKNFPNAPLLYEAFCGEFFKDIGLKEIEVTRSSNDFGIDIVATLPLNHFNYLSPQKIIIMAQVKYYESQLDTSFIRKLIGDSLFIKFDLSTYSQISHDPLCLYLIGHNGFTKDAKTFAVKNGIQLLDSQSMCDFISTLDNPNISFSAQFLMKTYKRSCPKSGILVKKQ